MNKRELATVLAALRYWQRKLPIGAKPEADIATDGGIEPLSAEEIDALCEKINCPPDDQWVRRVNEGKFNPKNK